MHMLAWYTAAVYAVGVWYLMTKRPDRSEDAPRPQEPPSLRFALLWPVWYAPVFFAFLWTTLWIAMEALWMGRQDTTIFLGSTGGTALGACGVRRERRGFWKFAFHTLTLGPWHVGTFANDPSVVVRAALRKVILSETPWHRIVVAVVAQDGLGAVVPETAWRYAASLGHTCELSRGSATIWGWGAKARLLRALTSDAESQEHPTLWPGKRYSRLDLQTTTPPVSPLPFVVLDEAELSSGQYELGLTPYAIQAAIQRGDTCYAVKDATGQVIYSLWGSSDPAFLASLLPPELVPGAYYAYGAYTLPSHRRQGLHGRALATLAALVRDRYECILLRTNPENTRSIRVSSKAGFVEVTPVVPTLRSMSASTPSPPGPPHPAQ